MRVFDQINLLPPKPAVWRWWMLTALLLLASLWLFADAWRRYQERVELAEAQATQSLRLQRAEEKRAHELERRDQQLRELDELVKPWLGVAAFPWDEVMLSVERLKMPGLRVVGLSVDAKQGTAQLLIECIDAEQAAEAARTLDLGRPDNDRRWHLVRVQLKAAQNSGYEAELSFKAGHSSYGNGS